MLEILPPPPLPCNANAAVAADAPTNRGAIYALPNPLASSSLVNRQRWCPMPYAPDARPAICVFSVASEHEERDERDDCIDVVPKTGDIGTDRQRNKHARQPASSTTERESIPEHIYLFLNQPINPAAPHQSVEIPSTGTYAPEKEESEFFFGS